MTTHGQVQFRVRGSNATELIQQAKQELQRFGLADVDFTLDVEGDAVDVSSANDREIVTADYSATVTARFQDTP